MPWHKCAIIGVIPSLVKSLDNLLDRRGSGYWSKISIDTSDAPASGVFCYGLGSLAPGVVIPESCTIMRKKKEFVKRNVRYQIGLGTTFLETHKSFSAIYEKD
jgi:hypothetical protein